MENMMEHGHEQEIIHSHETDDCCPADGHKKQIEDTIAKHVTQKQGLDIKPLILQDNVVAYTNTTAIIPYPISYYPNPPHDRHQLFFVDTIRLLL